ncbi:MAG: transglycosylase family protein [Candidatus Dormibacteria bacterium]
MAAIRQQESGGNYTAGNRGSGASGAYQFLFNTWRSALAMAGLGNSPYANQAAAFAPPAIQDAAAHALMQSYYNEYGQSWYNVAEAWYGGGGAVGHPNRGGGPGYPNVGQYADQIMAHMANICGNSAGGGPPTNVYTPGPGIQATNQAWNTLVDMSVTDLPRFIDIIRHAL